MTDSLPATDKNWYQSRTIQGAIVVIAAQIAAALGAELDAGALAEVLASIGTLIGAAMSIQGRLRAVQPIAPLRSAPRD
jgi:predicted phage tail protein